MIQNSQLRNAEEMTDTRLSCLDRPLLLTHKRKNSSDQSKKHPKNQAEFIRSGFTALLSMPFMKPGNTSRKKSLMLKNLEIVFTKNRRKE